MTICKELCTKNGGEITAESGGEGQGSTFAFSMTFEEVNEEAPLSIEDGDLKSEEFKSKCDEDHSDNQDT